MRVIMAAHPKVGGDLQGCRLINMCPAMTDGCTLKEPRFT